MRRRHILLTAVVAAGALSPDAHAGWRAPVDGAVTSPFEYRRNAPFERGSKRGTTFAAREGETVHAACTGRVSFAGASPRGHVVTVRCGALVATHLGLASVGISSGADVRRGSTIGKAGSRGVGLGARRARDRWGYVDPLRLIEPSGPISGRRRRSGDTRRPSFRQRCLRRPRRHRLSVPASRRSWPGSGWL